jgi:HSP20 family protein
MAGPMTKAEPRTNASWIRPRNVFQEMEEMLSDVFPTEQEGWFTKRFVPALDLVEGDKDVTVKMDLPGMKAEEIDIQVHGNLLTINGERKEEREEKGTSFHRIERRTGSFSRSMTLPCPINEKEIDAKYENGILCVTMPKAEEAKGRKITVKG